VTLDDDGGWTFTDQRRLHNEAQALAHIEELRVGFRSRLPAIERLLDRLAGSR
jgi:hypothetical protein